MHTHTPHQGLQERFKSFGYFLSSQFPNVLVAKEKMDNMFQFIINSYMQQGIVLISL